MKNDSRRAGLGYPHPRGRQQPKLKSLAERRRCLTYLVRRYDISERRACQAIQLHRSSDHYEPRKDAMDEGDRRTVALARKHPYWGYHKCHRTNLSGPSCGQYY